MLLALGVAPQQLVQLQLKTHGQAVHKNPAGKFRWLEQPAGWRKQHRTNGVQMAFGDRLARPFVVGARSDGSYFLLLARF